MFRWSFWRKVLIGFVVLIVLLAGFLAYRMKGPDRGYRVDLALPVAGSGPVPGVLEVGVAMRDITPDLSRYDSWTDANDDGKFSEGDGDSWQDSNGNGKRDLVWMAGFSDNRPAKGVHDKLWARAIAFRNNGVTVAMVTIDSIGILHEKFITVRKNIDPSLKIDHVMFSTLHNHESPDTMGIWSNIDGVGAILWKANFDYGYMALVQDACKQAVEEAVRALQPADMTIAEDTIEPDGFVDDSRLPLVYDLRICSARFVKHGTDETIATMVSWGNHVETLGSTNSLLTSDFAHYLREGMEKGVGEPNGVEGFGGMSLYFQGMVGGLMTQLHTTVPHRDGVQKFEHGTFEKAQALGENVAIVAAKSLRGDAVTTSENSKVAVAAQTIFAPVSGMYGYAIALGLIHPGWYWGKARTEVNAFCIGDLEILTIPGELYPEIGEGGVEAPEGGDFPGEPIEVPPLRKQMRGKVNMVIGLANDEIGYIIPKTQWDVDPPFAYGRDKDQYGEENSGGPDVAPVIHKEALAVLERLHGLL
ncbi:MAG: hypothetical protein SGI88_13030 [Candidatus Hydrogenedentes bacterium]|nr:hypothetical protein [Candidatus Hydrogenedentota bacterium]